MQFILLALIIATIIVTIHNATSLLSRIIYLIWFSLFMAIVGWIFFVLFIDFNPKLSYTSIAIVFIFWILGSIGILKLTDGEENTTQQSTPSVNEKIKQMNIGGKNTIEFIFNDNKIVRIKSINLAKIITSIIQKYNKNSFSKNELIDDYNFFKDNYKTSLDEQTYEKVLFVVKKIVDEGGTITVS